MVEETGSGDKRYRVICADDDPITRKMYEHIFKRNGFNTEVVASGEEAIGRFLEAPADALVLDVEMRGMTGLEVCRTLRELNAGRHVPIIIMSGVDSVEELTQVEETGASAFLPKPLQPDVLVEKCLFLIHRHELLQRMLENAESESDVIRDLLCSEVPSKSTTKTVGQ